MSAQGNAARSIDSLIAAQERATNPAPHLSDAAINASLAAHDAECRRLYPAPGNVLTISPEVAASIYRATHGYDEGTPKRDWRVYEIDSPSEFWDVSAVTAEEAARNCASDMIDRGHGQGAMWDRAFLMAEFVIATVGVDEEKYEEILGKPVAFKVMVTPERGHYGREYDVECCEEPFCSACETLGHDHLSCPTVVDGSAS